MKRISFFVVAAGFVVISALVAQTALTDGPKADAGAAKAKLAELRKQRIASLERVAKFVKEQSDIELGVSFRDVDKAEEDVIKAKLDVTDNRQERIELLKQRLAIATRTLEYLEEYFKANVRVSQVSQLVATLEVERAKAHRLKVEIRLQEEIAKAEAK